MSSSNLPLPIAPSSSSAPQPPSPFPNNQNLKKIAALAKQIALLQTWGRYASAAGLAVAGISVFADTPLSKNQGAGLAAAIVAGNVGCAFYLSYMIKFAGGEASVMDILTKTPPSQN